MAFIANDILGSGLGIFGMLILGAVIFGTIKIISLILRAHAALSEVWRARQETKIAAEEEQEAAAMPQKMAEEQSEETLEREDQNLAQKKQLLIRQLATSLRFGAASSLPVMNSILQLTTQQLNLFQRDLTLETKESAAEKRKNKKLKGMAKLKKAMERGELKEFAKKGKVLSVFAKNRYFQMSNFLRQKVGMEQREQQAIFAEERLTEEEKKEFALSIKLIKKLISVLKSEAKTVRQLEKAFQRRATIIKLNRLGRQLFNQLTEELRYLSMLQQDENVTRGMELREKGLSDQLGATARQASAWEQQELRLFGPLEKVKA